MKKRERLTEDGLPVDAKEWTRADWQDLHEAMQKVRRQVAARHKKEREREKPLDTREQ